MVFLEELRDREGNPQAVIVQKGDGGFLYATTDLAAARYRAATLHADRVLYFIDDRQKLHMQQVFAISRRAGFVPERVSLEHHPFGKMLGEDGKPFKTRSGGTVKLAELLAEAVERAARLLVERNTELAPDERADSRAHRRDRRGEIRRPGEEPHQRLCVQLGSNAELRGQYRALPAVRMHPCRQHPAQGRGRSRDALGDRSASARPRNAPWR